MSRSLSALFFGLKAAVLAIVVEAVVRVGRRALKNNVMVALAAAAFIGIFFFGIPFPLIMFGGGINRLFIGASRVSLLSSGSGHGSRKRRRARD